MKTREKILFFCTICNVQLRFYCAIKKCLVFQIHEIYTHLKYIEEKLQDPMEDILCSRPCKRDGFQEKSVSVQTCEISFIFIFMIFFYDMWRHDSRQWRCKVSHSFSWKITIMDIFGSYEINRLNLNLNMNLSGKKNNVSKRYLQTDNYSFTSSLKVLIQTIQVDSLAFSVFFISTDFYFRGKKVRFYLPKDGPIHKLRR